MTIYAIVNNILSSTAGSNDCKPVWTLISPASILQGGNPFFVPDFAGHFEARTALAIRIGKLGKGIAPRFANRYIEAAAPCILFIAPELLQSLRSNGLPWSEAISYDKCLAIGKFLPCNLESCYQCKIKLNLDSSDSSSEYIWDNTALRPGIEETISAISRDNTLKTGDIILFGIADNGPQVSPDMRALLSINETNSLKFNIR